MWNWRLGWVLRYQSTALIQSPYSNNQLNPELLRTTQTKWSYVPGVNPLAVDPNLGRKAALGHESPITKRPGAAV